MRIRKILVLIIMLQWMAMMFFSDAYSITYVVIFAASLLCFAKLDNINQRESVEPICRYSSYIFSVLLSLSVLFSNYQIWTEIIIKENITGTIRIIYAIMLFILMGLGGFFVFLNILLYVAKREFALHINPEQKKVKTSAVFFQSFL